MFPDLFRHTSVVWYVDNIAALMSLVRVSFCTIFTATPIGSGSGANRIGQMASVALDLATPGSEITGFVRTVVQPPHSCGVSNFGVVPSLRLPLVHWGILGDCLVRWESEAGYLPEMGSEKHLAETCL